MPVTHHRCSQDGAQPTILGSRSEDQRKGSARLRYNLITNSHICGGNFQQARTILSYILIPQISLIVAIAYNKSFLRMETRNSVNKWPYKLISSHSIWERSISSKQCLIGIQSRTGVNLIGHRSLPGPPGASGLRVRPSGFSGCRGSRSTSPCQDLIVITYKYRGQSVRMHKTGSKDILLTTKTILTRRS